MFHSRSSWFSYCKRNQFWKKADKSEYCLSLTRVHTIFLNNTLALIVCLPMQIYQSSSLVVLVLLAFCHRLEAQPSKQSTISAAGMLRDSPIIHIVGQWLGLLGVTRNSLVVGRATELCPDLTESFRSLQGDLHSTTVLWCKLALLLLFLGFLHRSRP